MLTAMRDGVTDVAVASRFAQGASTKDWANHEREKLSGAVNALARKLSGVDLSDPMSGYFLLRIDLARGLVPRFFIA